MKSVRLPPAGIPLEEGLRHDSKINYVLFRCEPPAGIPLEEGLRLDFLVVVIIPIIPIPPAGIPLEEGLRLNKLANGGGESSGSPSGYST